jgi:ketosteroid isomerase-like protein
VTVEWIARGKSAKGKPYENYYNVMFEVKNGKVQTVREYVDTLYAKEVLFS